LEIQSRLALPGTGFNANFSVVPYELDLTIDGHHVLWLLASDRTI
jgi:hypothetical protein